MNKRYRLGEIEEAVSEMEELIDIEDDIAEIDDKLPDAFIGRGDAYVMWAERQDGRPCHSGGGQWSRPWHRHP